MAKQTGSKTPAPRVINIDRNGKVFNPAERTVTREECPEVYRVLERIISQSAAQK